MQAGRKTYSKREVIGLTGGTFDPIHFGHLRMAQELAESLQLSAVRFLPAAHPPHKPPPIVSAEHRSAMVRLGIAGNAIFSCDERELHRVGASYTIDTLLSLRNELGADISLVLLMGSDAFTKFDTWHHWQEIIQLCHISLVQRPEEGKQEPLSEALHNFLQSHYTEDTDDLHRMPSGFVTMQKVTALDISSTVIRRQLKQQHSVRYLLPDSVIEYIRTYQLYTK